MFLLVKNYLQEENTSAEYVQNIKIICDLSGCSEVHSRSRHVMKYSTRQGCNSLHNSTGLQLPWKTNIKIT
jgi:hypothetical protein